MKYLKFLILIIFLFFAVAGCGKNATFTKNQPFVVDNIAPISKDVSKYMTKRGDIFSAPAVIYAPTGMFEIGDTVYLSKKSLY